MSFGLMLGTSFGHSASKGVGGEYIDAAFFSRPFDDRSYWNIGLPVGSTFSALNNGAYDAGTAYVIGDLAYWPPIAEGETWHWENHLYVKLTDGTGHALPTPGGSNVNWQVVLPGLLSWLGNVTPRYSAATTDPTWQLRFNTSAWSLLSDGTWDVTSDADIWASGVATFPTDYNGYSTAAADASGVSPTPPTVGTYHPKGAGLTDAFLSPSKTLYAPSGLTISSWQADWTAIIRQPDGSVLELFAAKVLSSNRIVCGGYKITRPNQYGDGVQNGFRASMIPGYAGMITKEEWATAWAASADDPAEIIPHKLALLVPRRLLTMTGGPAKYPALTADSQLDAGAAYLGTKLIAGQTLALPASFTSNAMYSSFYGTEAWQKWGRILKNTLMTHGAVVVDRGGDGISFLSEEDPSVNGLNSYDYDDFDLTLRLMLNNLQKVAISASEYDTTAV